MTGQIILWIAVALVVGAALVVLLRQALNHDYSSVADAFAPPPPAGPSSRPAAADKTTTSASHPRSAPAAADGSAPSHQFVVKASTATMHYYTTDAPRYTRIRADVWFRSAADAEAAGFASADHHR